MAPATGSCHRFENVEFDELMGELRVSGQPVAMEPRPLQVLKELLLHVNEVVTKEELFEAVWKDRPTVDHVLANAISKLRGAMGEAGGGRIVTVPRVGYRLSGPVQRVDTVAPRTLFSEGQPVPGRKGFVLERALGEASRSEVWLARHSKLGHQQVFKFATDGRGLSALKREYTLFRVLNKELGPRDDLVTIRDTQFQQAPYFMECDYGGSNLLQWAEEGGRLSALPLQERLALFVQVAQAVAAAHSVGVLHRDLKPANVLVSGMPGQWLVRLTDFGSGRLLQPEKLAEMKLTALGLTQAAASLENSPSGTYLYTAPELLGGHAPTTQSDVYSLGVLLWQMAAADLRRAMASGWQREVPDPLLVEEITSATEGLPEARTASAANLVLGLQQLDARRAERSRREAHDRAAAEALAQADRLRARRPWVWAGMTGLALGFAATSWMYLQAERARAAAVEVKHQVQAVSDFLHQDVLDSPDVLISGRVAPVSLMDVMRRAALTVSERFKGQPIAEATVRRKIAETYLRRAAVAQALFQLKAAEKLLIQFTAADSDELLAVRFLLARSLIWGQSPAGRKLLEATEALAGPQRLQANTDLGVQASRARVEFLLDAGKAVEAIPLAKRMIEQTDALFPVYSARRIDARQKLAEAYVRAGQLAQAQPLFAEVARAPYNQPGMADEFRSRELASRAEKLTLKYQIDEAEPLVQEWYLLSSRADPPNPFFLAWAEIYRGDIQLFRGRFKPALDAYQAALPLFAQSVGPDHVYITAAQLRMADAAREAGYHEAALALYTTVDNWYRANASRAGHAGAQFGRVQVLVDLKRVPEALEALDSIKLENLAVFEQRPGLDAWVQAERGRILLALGRREEGQALLSKAVPLLQLAGVPAWHLARYSRLL